MTILYLRMHSNVFESAGEATLDNELLYAIAHVGDLSDLEDFLATPNIAKVELIGDRLFSEGASVICFCRVHRVIV